MIVGHDDGHLVFLIVTYDTADFCRAQSIPYKNLGIFGMFDNIYFFSAKLLYDSLNAHAAHPDTGSHSIDIPVVGFDCYFCAAISLAHDSHDINHPLTDFGNFQFKQIFNESRMSPGKNHRDVSRRFSDI